MRKQEVIVLGSLGDMKNRIKELRVAAGLTQPKLARLAGTTKNQLAKLESGDRRLSDHWAQRLAPHLGVNPYELFMPASSIIPLRFVPVVGHIASGRWQEAIENAEGHVPAVSGGNNVFALKARGDSMDMLIEPQGYVYVDPDDRELIDGCIYVVVGGDGEATARTFHASPARLAPCSANPALEEIVVGSGHFSVIGRVIGSYSPH